MENPPSVAVSGPLERFAAGFASSLIHQGYRRQSTLIQIHLFAHLSAWLLDQRLEPGELSATDVARFLAARRRTGATRYVSEKAMRAILTYLRNEGVVSVPPVLAATGPVMEIAPGTQPATYGICLQCRLGASGAGGGDGEGAIR